MLAGFLNLVAKRGTNVFSTAQFFDDPFKRLKDQMCHRMKEEMVSEKMLDVAKGAFKGLLRTENVILSRAEHQRLFRAVVQEMVNDMLSNL